jgi:hypothetical protein
MKTKITSTPLTLQTISNELQLKEPQDVFLVLQKNISTAMEDFKLQFMEYVNLQLIDSTEERRELLLIVRSEINSVVWEMRLMKMASSGYQIFNEFIKKYQINEYFGSEKSVIRYFKPSNVPELISKITTGLKTVFENTNSAKYANVDKWFDMFSSNLKDEFENYPYICWERIVIALKKEKPLDFPSLNEILKRLEFYESAFQKPQIEFLQKIGVL